MIRQRSGPPRGGVIYIKAAYVESISTVCVHNIHTGKCREASGWTRGVSSMSSPKLEISIHITCERNIRKKEVGEDCEKRWRASKGPNLGMGTSKVLQRVKTGDTPGNKVKCSN